MGARAGERQVDERGANGMDVVFSLDDTGRFKFVSSAITKFGYSPADLTGKHFRRFVHPDDIPGLQSSFLRTLAGTSEPFEFRALDKEGGEHIVRTSSRALHVP
ncbi:MAG: PAS domain-containing protein, partial [Nannocystaceae bacterium]